MTNIIPLHRPSIARLECTACGATADAACNCGAPYVPAARRAAEAVAASPEKSNRMLAAEIGVSEPTVRRARKSTASPDAVGETRIGKDGKARRLPTKNNFPADRDDLTPQQQVEYDKLVAEWGPPTPKARKKSASLSLPLPPSACDYDPEDPDEVAEPGDSPATIRRRIFLYRAAEALRHAKENGLGKAETSEIDKQIISAAQAAADAWQAVYQDLQRRAS